MISKAFNGAHFRRQLIALSLWFRDTLNRKKASCSLDDRHREVEQNLFPADCRLRKAL